MIQIHDKLECTGCAACYNVCPVKAIEMKEDEEGFLYPNIDAQRCIGCNKCEFVCPLIHVIDRPKDLLKCYAAYNTDEKDRNISSSGGIFIALARRVLSENGIVFGAAYDDVYMAYHKAACNDEELKELVGSKYLQSRIETVYQCVMKELQKGRRVLFVGSGCQIGGLLGYLRKDYENLITVDFICLGVPSPKIWSDFLDTFFDRKNIKYINFKDKTLGWHVFSLRIDGDKRFIKNGRSTYFFTGYFKQLFSRPSCSNCLYKRGNRISDITISDCWGYKNIAPELDDNKGLSSIICHSEKGLYLFTKIKEFLIWKETDIEDIYKYNSNYNISAPMGKERNNFWNDYHKMSKKKLFCKYCKPDKRDKLKALISFLFFRRK